MWKREEKFQFLLNGKIWKKRLTCYLKVVDEKSLNVALKNVLVCRVEQNKMRVLNRDGKNLE